MSRYRTLYNNTLIFSISNFASKILGFLMLPLYTRVLSPEEFGTSDLIILTIGLLTPLLTISINEAALRFALDEKYDNKQVFSYGFKLILLSFIFLLLIYPLLNMINGFKQYSVFFYLIYLTQVFNLYFNQFVRGIDKIKLVGVVGVIQTMVVVISNILLLVVFKFKIEGFLASILLSNFVALSVLFYWGELKKYTSFTLPIDNELKHEMLAYAIPLTPNKLSWWLNNSANKFIISGYTGVSNLGIFSAASRIPSILITLQGIFIQAWQLSAINEFEKTDSIQFFTKVYRVYNFSMLLGCSVLILFTEPLTNLLFGAEFKDAWIFVPFLLISVIFGALIGFLNSINLAVKKTKSIFIAVIIGASLGIILNFIFIPKYGIMATSISTAISYFTIWLIRSVESRKHMKLKISYLKDFISYIIIVIQAIIIITINNQYVFLYAIICMLLIIILNKRTFLDMLNFIWMAAKKYKKRNA